MQCAHSIAVSKSSPLIITLRRMRQPVVWSNGDAASVSGSSSHRNTSRDSRCAATLVASAAAAPNITARGAQCRGGLPRGGEDPSTACVLKAGRCVPAWLWRQKIYPQREPGVLVRIKGQPPLAATVYELEKLRCNLCGEVYTAAAPPEAGDKKYDETAVAMMAVLRYGTGVPWNRTGGLEANFGIPLPPATQCEILTAHAVTLQPALEELKRQAAQSEVFHHDDTSMRVLSLERDTDISPERTGVFTSGLVWILEKLQIALYFTGCKHAGENLAEVLKLRSGDLPPIIQMCDALSRNVPKIVETPCLSAPADEAIPAPQVARRRTPPQAGQGPPLRPCHIPQMLPHRFPSALQVAFGVRIDGDSDRVPALVGRDLRVHALLMAQAGLSSAQHLEVDPTEADLLKLSLNGSQHLYQRDEGRLAGSRSLFLFDVAAFDESVVAGSERRTAE